MVFKSPWDGLVDNTAAQEALSFVETQIENFGITSEAVKHTYNQAIRGFNAELTDQQLQIIRSHPLVDYVEQDRRFKANLSATGSSPSSESGKMTLSSQTTPWGVQRVGGNHEGTGERAWIIDSGIDLDHPDLNVDVANSASFIAEENADDVIGHGTHVAGTIAALDNSQGVVGVAAGAEVVAVKVIARNDSGSVGDVVAGVDYVAGLAVPNDVINMSIGGPASNAIDQEVVNAANAGLRFTIAAGNNSQDADNESPGRVEHANVWTISAYDDNNAFATFSNFGNPPIEFGGPGVDISSSAIDGGITTMSGTSMAAPHIAGLLLAAPQGITVDGTVINDPDGDPDQIAMADLPLTVIIGGPHGFNDGQTGYFTANISDAEGAVSYQWYYRQESYSSWIADGGNSASYSHTFQSAPGGGTAHSAVKVEVTSAGESASDIHSVDVYGCQQGVSSNSASTNIIIPC